MCLAFEKGQFSTFSPAGDWISKMLLILVSSTNNQATARSNQMKLATPQNQTTVEDNGQDEKIMVKLFASSQPQHEIAGGLHCGKN